MNAKVSFNEVQNYARAHNVDFKEAAQKLGLTAQEAADLEKLGGDPGAPVDGLERKPVHKFTLKSGRRVEVYKDASGKNTFKYFAADGTQLKEDYFLKQEGLTGSHFAVNDNGQLVSVKNETKPEEKAEEQGFFAKAWSKIKSDFSDYGQNFVKAWNNSDGFIETTGALIGATTRTATDMVTDYAENVEKGVTEITGSETAGKVAKYVTGAGLAADAVEAIDQVGNWGADKIRAAAANYTGSERALLEGFADFVEDMNAADIALMFVGGVGAAKFAKDLPKIMNLLKISPAMAKATGAAAVVAGAASMTSCSDFGDEDPTEFNSWIQVNITIPQNDQTALINAFKEGIDALLAKMDELGYKVDEYGDQIIKLLTDNNFYLKNIANDLLTMKDQNEQLIYGQDEIIEILTNINSTVQTLESLVAATNENITINGQNISDKLTEILNAIKTGQANTMEALDKYIEELKNLLLDVIANQKEDIQINEENGMTLEQILEELQNMDGMTQDKLEKMLEILASIESIGKDINNKLDIIMGKFDEVFPDNSDIKAALERIEQYLKENNDKTDVTNNLLEQLLNQYNNGGISQEDLQKLLDAIAANGDKIDATNQLLAKIQNQDAEFQKTVLALLANVGTDYTDVLNRILEATMNNSEKLDAIAQLLAKIQDQDEKFQQNILNAIDKLGVDITGQLNKIVTAINNISVGGGNTSNLEALLNKVLEKMDSNTAAIIDAISNIKPGEGGNVDLSSLEKMLSELLQLTSKNNSLLESIDGKMDVIKLTIEAAKDEIIAHLGNGGGNVDVDAILKKLDEFMSLSNANSEAILKKMDTIINLINNINDSTYDDSALMAKLDDILAAIKDHNITVDITGKVECNCNCGGNHEGILGDLDDILG